MRYCFLVFLIFIVSSAINAQVEKDSLDLSSQSYSNKLLSNNFDKQLNTYNFASQLKYNYSAGNFFFGIKESFLSTITKTVSQNIKDEHYLKFFGLYGLSEQLKLGLTLNNYIYSDDRSLAMNKVANTNSSLFIKFVPQNTIEITPFAGISHNSQINEKDKGYIYGTEASADNFEFGDFDVSSMLRIQNEDISPRKNTLRIANLTLNSRIEETVTNSITGYFTNQRKDFYSAADEITAQEFNITNNIQSRLESNYLIEDRIKFLPVNSPFSFDLHGRLVWREIERTTRYTSLQSIASTAFDSKVNESRIELLSSADYRTGDLNINFKFSFLERDEKHSPRKIEGLNEIIFNERENSETQKNNSSQLATISLSAITNFSVYDKLSVSIFHRKLKYDTPSNQNNDDRDELLSIGRILYERKINSFLSAYLNLEGSLNKTVYIFSQRSSNNNIQRIIKLSSGGIFQLGKIRSSNSAEISANYTVFDYEELNPNYRSYSFRQFIFRDSTSYKLDKNIRLFFSGYVKLSEQGDFKWSNFSSKPLRFLDERFIEPKIYYEYSALTFGIGIRYFSLSSFNIKNGKVKEKVSDYISLGPLSEIIYEINDSISFRTYGWYEFITTTDNLKREMANFNLKLLYKL